MKRFPGLLIMLAAGWSASAPAAEAVGDIPAELWSRPRTGERLLAVPVLNDAVRRWMRDRDRYLVIQHRGGESGALWAAQLEDWLVALGIPSDAVETRPSDVPQGVLRLAISY